MKRTLSIIVTVTALSLAGLLAPGSCRRSKTTGDAQPAAPAETRADTSALTAQVDIPMAPDPQNAIRFTLIYQNNLNGEFDSCG